MLKSFKNDSILSNATFIALGSNQTLHNQSSVQLVRRAIDEIAEVFCSHICDADFFRSPSIPADSGPDYVNTVVAICTDLPPQAVLERLHHIESHFDRVREARWAARTLDLDLIAQGDTVLPDRKIQMDWVTLSRADQMQIAPDRLILPHPRMQDRAFVLTPMGQICPEWRHPVLGRTVTEMLAALPEADRTGLEPIARDR